MPRRYIHFHNGPSPGTYSARARHFPGPNHERPVYWQYRAEAWWAILELVARHFRF